MAVMLAACPSALAFDARFCALYVPSIASASAFSASATLLVAVCRCAREALASSRAFCSDRTARSRFARAAVASLSWLIRLFHSSVALRRFVLPFSMAAEFAS